MDSALPLYPATVLKISDFERYRLLAKSASVKLIKRSVF
jgi:hypothetical protein